MRSVSLTRAGVRVRPGLQGSTCAPPRAPLPVGTEAISLAAGTGPAEEPSFRGGSVFPTTTKLALCDRSRISSCARCCAPSLTEPVSFALLCQHLAFSHVSPSLCALCLWSVSVSVSASVSLPVKRERCLEERCVSR